MQQFLREGLIGALERQGMASMPLLIAAFALAAAIGYLVGGLNFAVVISRVFYKDDIRRYGSGNAELADMFHTFGKKAVALTLLGDAAKALIATFAGTALLGDFLAGGYIAGLFLIIGHVYPVFSRFKGGMGIVAAAMMILCTCPVVLLLLLVMFVGIVASTKFLSVGSVMSMLLYPILLNGYLNVMRQPQDFRVIIALTVAVFVIYLHRSNIRRLFDGTETKLNLKKTPKNSSNSSKK